MNVTPQMLLVVAIFVLIFLPALFAIILSLVNWYTLRKTLREVSDIPKRLYHPLSREDQLLMQSWYTSGETSFRYPESLPRCTTSANPLPAVRALPAGTDLPSPYRGPEPARLILGPGNERKDVRRVNRALRDPEESVREAQHLMSQVTEAIRLFEEDPEDGMNDGGDHRDGTTGENPDTRVR